MNETNVDLLITFGCSWVFGVGCHYEPGMGSCAYKKHARDKDAADRYSFRRILKDYYKCDHINFAYGGASNQSQFRLAENFFASPEFATYQTKYKNIVVLWGITSVARNEAYFNQFQSRRSFFYTNKIKLSKCILSEHYDQDSEIRFIFNKLLFWNKFFKSVKIQNFWFDTFNHHDYDNESLIRDLVDMTPGDFKKVYHQHAGPDWPTWEKFFKKDFADVDANIKKEILDQTRWIFHKIYYRPMMPENLIGYDQYPRDLMGKLLLKNGIKPNNDCSYHKSYWRVDSEVDSDRIPPLIDAGILNPYSLHPTKKGHQQLSDILIDYLNLHVIR